VTWLISVANLLVIFGCAFWIRKKQDPAIRSLFWPAVLMKLIAGIGLGLIYRYYYTTGDTFILFDEARSQTQLFFRDPAAYFRLLVQGSHEEWKGAVRSTFLAKFASIVNIFTNQNYWITSLWFSFVSFLSSWYLVRTVTRRFPHSKVAAASAFLFLPTEVFWSSGILKEGLAFAALLIVARAYLKMMIDEWPGIPEVLLSVFSGWVLWSLKYYWAAVFLPVAATSLIVHYTAVRLKTSFRFQWTMWLILFSLLCFGVSFFHPNFYPDHFLQVVVGNHNQFAAISDPANLIHYNNLRPSARSIVLNSPWALCSGLFRPFLWEADNVWKAITAFENLFILVLFLSSLTQGRNLVRSKHLWLVLSVIIYIIFLCIFLALSTPNLGSLARYKIGFIPFLIFLITYGNPLVDSILLSFKKLKSD